MNNHDQANHVVHRLADILQLENDMLRAGRVRDVSELSEPKMNAWRDFEMVLEAYKAKRPSSAQRQRILFVIAMAKENARHFEAIRNGLRNVITRIDGATVNVGAYNQLGQQVAFTGASGGYLRKA